MLSSDRPELKYQPKPEPNQNFYLKIEPKPEPKIELNRNRNRNRNQNTFIVWFVHLLKVYQRQAGGIPRSFSVSIFPLFHSLLSKCSCIILCISINLMMNKLFKKIVNKYTPIVLRVTPPLCSAVNFN